MNRMASSAMPMTEFFSNFMCEVLRGKGNELDCNQTPLTDTRKRMFYQIISPCKGPGSLTIFSAAKAFAALTK